MNRKNLPNYGTAWKILLLLFLFFQLEFLRAQQSITGIVTDGRDGSPLTGASVYIKGTTQGTITGLDGKYTLPVSGPESVIVFQFVGYQTVEIPAGSNTELSITLNPDFTQIDEIVVIGYGAVKKSDLTGSVSVVTGTELKKSNMTNVGSALQGKAAGVMISNTSGAPGSSVNVRIRGVGSINSGAQPLVVIDGIPVGSGGGALSGLNPEDLESVQVLKDASAAAIYGTEGANGVILIQTRRGTSDEPKITLRLQSGFSQLPRKMAVMNADEYVEYYKAAYDEYNRTHPDALTTMPAAYTDVRRAEFGNVSTDWQDLITLDKAWNQNYYLGVTGGNEKGSYMISANYVDEKGVLITTWRDNLTLKANSDYKIGKRIKLGESISFGISHNQVSASQQGNPWLTATIASPLMPVYSETAKGGFQGPDEYITGRNDRTNTYAELRLNSSKNRGNGFFGSFYGEIELFKGLSFKNTLGLMYNDGRGGQWRPAYDLAQRSNPTSYLLQSTYDNNKAVWDQQLTYYNQFGKHSITGTAVHSMQKFHSDGFQATNSNFLYEYLQVLGQGDPTSATASQGISDTRFESFLGRFIYDYAGKYYLTASIRRDGSSRFGSSNRWGNFPSFSLAWKLNEDLLKNVSWINMFKLRYGWGQTGNADIGEYIYDAYISTSQEHVYTLGLTEYAIFGAAPFYNIPSPDVKWESVSMSNLGFDLNMFSNRIQTSFEYYRKVQDDLLVQLPLPNISGMSGDGTPPWVNLGKMNNTGFESTVSYRKMEGVFTYELGFNITTIKNRIKYLPAGDVISDNNVAMVGRAIGGLYGFVAERILQESDFVTDENGHAVMNPDGSFTGLFPFQTARTSPGDIKFKDLNQDGTINDQDRTIIGKVIPDLVYGFTLNCSYKIFSLSVALTGEQGVDVYNQFRSSNGLASGDNTSKDENKLSDVMNYWTPENPVKYQTRISITDENNNSRFSSWWIEDASYLRLRDIQLGINVPARLIQKTGVTGARIFGGATNLLTFTKYSGYDPEVRNGDILNTNIDGGAYPVPRMFNFGFSIDF